MNDQCSARALGARALRVLVGHTPSSKSFDHLRCLVAYAFDEPAICRGYCTTPTICRFVRRNSRIPGSDVARMVQWLLDNACYPAAGPANDRVKLWNQAALDGLPDLLEVLKRAGVERCLVRQSQMWIAAAKADSPSVVRWLAANAIPRHADACGAAAEAGNLAVLAALRGLDPPFHWTVMTTRAAALHDHAALFKWAVLRGCPCDDDSWKIFRRRKNYDVLAWGQMTGFHDILRKG